MEILEKKTGLTNEYEIKTKERVSDFLKRLNLYDKCFAVLKNGLRADLDDTIIPGDKIAILPKIAGG